MRFLAPVLRLMVVLLAGRAGAAQQLPPDLLVDEDFQHTPPGHYRVAADATAETALTAEGYRVSRLSGTSLTSQMVNPPAPALNQNQDFVIEGELRGQGSIGMFWGGKNTATGNNLLEVHLNLGATPPTLLLAQLQAGAWTVLARPPMPTAVPPADWHRIRIVRTGPTVAYWLDGTLLLEQRWPEPVGSGIGVTVENAGSSVTLRRLRIWHHSLIRLVPGVPPDLRRERLAASGLNTEREENCPLVSADGRYLYFSRVMGDLNAPDNPSSYNSDTFVSERGADGQWGPARSVGAPLNTTDASNFPAYVSPDGQSLLMSGRYSPSGILMGGGVSRTRRQADGTWTMPQPLPEGTGNRADFGVRNVSYCMDASGTVLLCSAVLKTDLSNTDIYFCRRQPDGTWTAPVPLPATINTSSNEYTPFLAPDGKTLYFASNGHPGYGAEDIFMSTRLDDSWLRWSEPQNLGPAVNTWHGEAYFSLSAAGDYAYLVSNVGDGQHGDIYRLALPPALQPALTLLVRGRVLDATTGQPIAAAEVRYEQLPTGAEAGVVLPTFAGSFEATLPAGQLYGLRATAPGYLSVNESVDLTAAKKYALVTQDLLLMPLSAPLGTAAVKLAAPGTSAVPGQVKGVAMPAVVPEKKMALNNVFFVRTQATLLASSFPELSRLAQTLKENPALRIRLEGHTDNVGEPSKNQTLSEQRVAAIKAYLVKHGVAPARLATQGFGGSRPVAPNDTEEHKRQNRRVEFVITEEPDVK